MWIIGDPHGCFLTFKALLLRLGIKKEEYKDSVVVAGDLVDRGPRSAELVSYVIKHQIPCVRGNHEQMLIDHLDGRPFRDNIWINPRNGGLETLDSYKCKYDQHFSGITGLELNKKIHDHAEFLNTLPRYLEFPEIKNDEGRHLIVTHACLYTKNWQQEVKTKDVFWNRSNPVDIQELYSVFGHTPLPDGPQITKFFANIDTGCFFSLPKWQAYGLPKGCLTALHFPSMEVIQQDCID